jgi:transcriptional regulator with GAF, ATPase, and Fis domain
MTHSPLRWETGRNPNISDLFPSLHFNPNQGLIWLDDQRMVLFHMEDIGVLRQELIDSCGVEAARSFITRMGYASGGRAAKVAMKVRKPDSNSFLDTLYTGAQLHALEGITTTKLITGEADPATGHLFGEFLWRSSFESQVHLSSYGVCSHPACWLLAGYGSGFLSTCMGKRILVREVACRAMGDDECRGIAKPLEAWNAEAAEDVRYLETPELTASFSDRSAHKPKAIRRPRPTQALELATTRTPPVRTATGPVVGASAAFNAVMHKVQRVAPTNTTVLFLGESGVGKSSIAKELHRLSKRGNEKFVEINCAAIPEQLMEAELFGVERGAYTGAHARRPGRFEQANRGTLFLDEIGTLSFTAQGKLLRVIQNGEFEPLGSVQTKKVDVRIIAATNLNLQTCVKQGTFREDLFFRLNVFPILIPPLRKRRDDIPLLLQYMLRKYGGDDERHVKGVTAAALRAILNYEWPGNIREMENVIERGVILSDPDEPLDVRHLFSFDTPNSSHDILGLNSLGLLSKCPSDNLAGYDGDPDAVGDSLDEWAANLIKSGRQHSFDEAGDALIRAAVKETKGNLAKAATILGLTRNQVEYRAKKIGLRS